MVAAVTMTALLLTAPAEAQELLPDLDQQVPSDLSVKRDRVGGKTVFRLGFASASANVGAGPLSLVGRRRTRVTPRMTVNQLVSQSDPDAVPRLVRGVGEMSYVVHPDHKHWHLLGFERYEIRVPGGGADAAALRRDRKTGFCVGDRFPVFNAKALPGFDPTPGQADLCGMGQPEILTLFSGISVGYVDRYEAHIEGQHIDLTGLPTGEYELVHTVNTEGRIVERDYTNNASSVLFSLAWPHGRAALPRLRVLRQCPASESCSP